jgi:hypothetical protein
MEFGGHRYYQEPITIPHGYYYNDRNIPLIMTNSTRPDPRAYPMGGPVGGTRLRGSLGREDNILETGQSRRRIGIACARCRKRKIRCSGDPGNGTGCTNCRSAGVEPSACVFHRVGSDHVSTVLDSINLANSLAGIATPHTIMPAYNTGGPMFPRAGHHTYPQLDTKSVYPPTWTVPYSEDTSPVEAYNLDQPGAYLPNQGTMPPPNTYGSNYRWGQAGGKTYPNGTATYLGHEPLSVYGNPGLSYVQSSTRSTASETHSPLNMTALQLSLPGGPYPRSAQASDQTAPQQRQLPIPMPSPAQTTRNVVDQLQDQRLRSAQAMSGTSRTNAGSFPKLELPYNSDCEVQVPVGTDASASDNATQATTSAPMPNTTDATLSFLPIATPVPENDTSDSTETHLSFSASTLLEPLPVPAVPTTYSNFRNYNLPTSSSTETTLTLTRQESQTNLYSFNPQSKRHSGDSVNDSAALVSGHRYTPLNQNQLRHQQSFDDLRRDSFATKAMPTHRASTSDLDSV